MNSKPDFLILGAGVIGLCFALKLRKHHPQASISVIEKEKEAGFHASGRNSGVLHAGFYYSAESLKAKFTKEGCARWKEYVKEKGINLNSCGKLVVAQNESELSGIEELIKRGKANGVEVYEVDEKEAKKIEARVKTYQKALWSPSTASLNPKDVIQHLVKDCQAQNIEIIFDCAYQKLKGNQIYSSKGIFEAGYIINCAGLYADKIAKDFGLSTNYTILPFKGLYLYSNEKPGSLKTNIYPVPDLKFPFLGVHYTITSEGKIKIGPTAIPAFWREHYQGFNRMSLSEMQEIVWLETKLFLSNQFHFRDLALVEIKKYLKSHLVGLASHLIEGVKVSDYTKWGTPGIRAQLFNTQTQKLEMDFKFEKGPNSFHVLNAVSPAFTCALPFVDYLYEQM